MPTEKHRLSAHVQSLWRILHRKHDTIPTRSNKRTLDQRQLVGKKHLTTHHRNNSHNIEVKVIKRENDPVARGSSSKGPGFISIYGSSSGACWSRVESCFFPSSEVCLCGVFSVLLFTARLRRSVRRLTPISSTKIRQDKAMTMTR